LGSLGRGGTTYIGMLEMIVIFLGIEIVILVFFGVERELIRGNFEKWYV